MYTCSFEYEVLFCPSSGVNASILHYGHAGRPNDATVAEGDLLLFDMVSPTGTRRPHYDTACMRFLTRLRARKHTMHTALPIMLDVFIIGHGMVYIKGSVLQGGDFAGYATDITFTFPCNGVFTEAQRAIYTAVLDAQTSVIKRMRPGVQWTDMHRLAERIILKHLKVSALIATVTTAAWTAAGSDVTK